MNLRKKKRFWNDNHVQDESSKIYFNSKFMRPESGAFRRKGENLAENFGSPKVVKNLNQKIFRVLYYNNTAWCEPKDCFDFYSKNLLKNYSKKIILKNF